ncbi:MAG: TerC/Alx family metal homeostasis membrane protein [Alphaproteobacteria bacterium]|nr:TerC/Alx family metal homeostasis membrane protein [Alphaproteobacteria bacterium]
MEEVSLTFGQEAFMWAVFFVIVPVVLYLDLHVFNKKDHVIGLEESLRMSGAYFGLGLLFGLYVWYNMGDDHALNYYTAFVIEYSLSLDNLFVITVIFSTFAIPKEYQHRVLVWGIIGVILMRGVMIGAGAAIVHQYSWVLLLFAAILIVTGIKMLMMKSHDEEIDSFEDKAYVKFLKKHINFTTELHGHDFWVQKKISETSEKMGWFATPLLLALVIVEVTDLMFAFDSIPAVLAITTEPYVVYASNIFAILGLRALFFAVENLLSRFILMKYALSIVLIFIGGKVFYNEYVGHISPAISLAITLFILLSGMVFSVLITSSRKRPSQFSGE